MSETQLLNLLNHYLVLEFQNNGLEGMCINEFLPLCAALVYPYRNEKIELTKNVITPIITSARNFTRRKDLAQYSLQGLRSYFKVNWLPNLSSDEQKRLLGCVSLIVKIEDTGYFSIKDNEIVHNAYLNLQNLPNIAGNYGEEAYEASEDNHPNEPNVEIIQGTALKTTDSEDIDSEENSENEEKNANRAERLYNRLVCSEGDKIKPLVTKMLEENCQYVWQLQISFDIWNEIKNNCEDVEISSELKWWKSKSTEKYKNEIATILLIYASEWNKREWNGQEGENLGKILNTSICKKVVDVLNIPCIDTTTDERRGQKRWLDALKIQGGLPLCYIYRQWNNGNINNSKLKFFSLLLQGDTEDMLDIEDLSLAYVHSYDSEDSIYHYIQTLTNKKFPWDDTDKLFGDVKFSDIWKILQELSNQKFSRRNYVVFKSGSCSSVSLKINLRASANQGRKYAYTEGDWRNWGFTDLEDCYKLEFILKRGESAIKSKTMIVERCMDGVWTPRGNYDDSFTLPLSKNEKYSLTTIITGFPSKITKETRPSKLIEDARVVPMYSDDNRTWINNKQGKKTYFACLVLDLDEYSHTPNIEELQGGYGWVSSTDGHKIELVKHDGKKELYYNEKDIFDVIVDEGALLSKDYIATHGRSKFSIRCQTDEEFKEVDVIEGDAKWLTLLQNNKGIGYKEVSFSKGKIIVDKQPKTIELSAKDKYWTTNELPYGEHKLQFVFTEKEGKEHTYQNTYFILPSDFNIYTNPQNDGLYVFSEKITGIDIKSNEQPTQISWNQRTGHIPFQRKKHKELEYQLEITFDDKDLLVLSVIPPYKDPVLIPKHQSVPPLPCFYWANIYNPKDSRQVEAESIILDENSSIWNSKDNPQKDFGTKGDYFTANAQEVLQHKENYAFYFYSIEKGCLKLEIDENGSLLLNNEKLRNDMSGVIFQSFADLNLSPILYYKSKKINNYTGSQSSPNVDIWIEQFTIAKEHRIRFKDIMHKGFKDKEHLINFLLGYFSKHRDSSAYLALWRLAREYKFDWICCWKAIKERERDDEVTKYYWQLLKKRPEAQLISGVSYSCMIDHIRRANDMRKKYSIGENNPDGEIKNQINIFMNAIKKKNFSGENVDLDFFSHTQTDILKHINLFGDRFRI